MLIKLKKTIEQFSWLKSFRNLCIKNMVYFFNKTTKNILSNYIPHETITCDDRGPPWINSKTKPLVQDINNKYRSYILSNKNPKIFTKVKYLQKPV